MINNTNVNIVTLSLDTELKAVSIGNGGYVKILEAPTSANILIHLNDRNADGIPLKAYHEINAKNIDFVFVSCNAVSGETIKILQAKTSEDFKLVTPVSDIAVDEIGGYSSSALALLDKVINPYLPPALTSIEHINSTLTEVLNKTLESDKIKFSIFALCSNTVYGHAMVRLDGALVARTLSYYNNPGLIHFDTDSFEFENVKGKVLTVELATSSFIALQEYTLKP